MQHIHLIGIGGSGLSAIARVLLESGYTVSGSDRTLSPLAQDLSKLGARVFEGHAPQHIAGADLVVRSSAVANDNPEVVAALAAGIPVLKRSDFLGRLLENHESIAVAGTHGKTTTTAMIAWMLYRLGIDPSYIIGGVSKNLANNAHAGSGKNFVIEADEYDRMFLGLHPQIIIITVMEHDHPDCYPTWESYQEAFNQFIQNLQPGGKLLVSNDDLNASALAANIKTGCESLSYGLTSSAQYQALDTVVNTSGGFSFKAHFQPASEHMADVHLQVPGLHNVRNAMAAMAAAHLMHLPLKEAAQALSEFSGTGRRFDILGETQGITIIDDYAHHPTEIRATLAAARSRYPQRRIWAVWQPHTFSRTQALFQDFITSFADADCVLVTPIYAAREHDNGFSASQLVEKMEHSNTRYLNSLKICLETLVAEVRTGDVVLILSAGDADQISKALFAELQRKVVKNG